MSKTADRVNEMEESATLKMANLAWELKDQGKDIISLSLGEPDFDTPEFIKEAAKAAITNNLTHYPPVSGYKDVREAICKKFKRDNGLNFNVDQIVISTGAKQSLMNLFLALVNPGEEVILPAPYWVSYKAMADFAKASCVEIKTNIDSDFKISPEQLRAALSPKTKVFIFSNPCNPSGSIYTKDELMALSEIFKDFPNCYIIADEIYEHINFEGENFSIGRIESIKNQVITVNGVAKGFAMTGWRIGYIGAPLHVAKACTKLQGQFTSGANTIGQMATKSAVEADPSCVSEMKNIFKRRRDLLIKAMRGIPGLKVNEPVGAFYLFPDVSHFFGKSTGEFHMKNTDDVSMYLLADALVATTPGESFGCSDNIRISYATSDEKLLEAVERMKKSFAKLS